MMPVRTTFIDDPTQDSDLPGVDPRYYSKRIGAADPWDPTYAHRAATAAAKDKARKELIRAVQREEERVRNSSFGGLDDVRSRDEIGRDLDQREIDGVKGLPDNAIDLE